MTFEKVPWSDARCTKLRQTERTYSASEELWEIIRIAYATIETLQAHAQFI